MSGMMTLDELADELKVAPKTIMRRIAKGEFAIPAYDLGTGSKMILRFDRNDLAAFKRTRLVGKWKGRHDL